MEKGFVFLYRVSDAESPEEHAISKDRYLTNPAAMSSLREEFIKDWDILLALSTHGPM